MGRFNEGIKMKLQPYIFETYDRGIHNTYSGKIVNNPTENYLSVIDKVKGTVHLYYTTLIKPFDPIDYLITIFQGRAWINKGLDKDGLLDTTDYFFRSDGSVNFDLTYTSDYLCDTDIGAIQVLLNPLNMIWRRWNINDGIVNVNIDW